MNIQDFFKKWTSTKPNLKVEFHDAGIEAMAFAEAYHKEQLRLHGVKASYSGLEEKLQEILNEYAEDIGRDVNKRDKFLSRMEFCQAHNFAEEERITRIKYNAVNMIIYRWQNMHEEIQELLNKWLS